MRSESKEIYPSSETPGNVDPPLAVLNACHPGAWERVGGIALTARTLFHLNQFGIKKVVLLLRTQNVPIDLKKWQGSLELQHVVQKEDIPATILSIAGLGEYFIYIDTAHLIDPRLVHALTVASETTLAYMDTSDREKQVIRAGLLKRKDLHIWAEQGIPFVLRQARSLLPSDIDSFCPEVRGPVSPYFVEVHSKHEAQNATRTLVRSQQKHVMDLPAQFIDPPFKNGLTRLFCNTPITPNMVTLTGLVVGLTIAWLFWHGYFLAGALTAFVVEVLDGVDGMLARTKLHFTKLGRYEDLLDYFSQTSWYIALGVGLRNACANQWPVFVAGLLILSDTTDNILYTLADKWFGKTIDLFSPFDAAFRRIAGRRNIYAFIFIIGFSLGYPFETSAVVAAWAALTASIHGIRLVQYGRMMKKIVSRHLEGT
jgi:phosphatidylglycerophosphate synthase